MSVAPHPSLSDDTEIGRLRTLYRLLASLIRANELQDVYDAALTSLLESTFADRAAILLYDDDGVIRFKASRGLSEEYQTAVTGHCPWPRGTLDAHPLVVSDVLLDEGLVPYRSIFSRERIRALSFLPLALDAGVFGKFMLYYAEPHNCTPGELEIAQAIAAHVALATQRKRAELAHARTEQLLQAIVDNTEAVIFLKDRDGRYLLTNRRHQELFHIPKSAALNQTDLDFFPAAIADRFRANDRIVLESRQSLKVEELAPHDDGMHTYVSLKFPLEGPDGEVAGVCGIATDITERERAEQERLELLAREQEARRTAELLNHVAPKLAAQLDMEKLTQEVTNLASALIGAKTGAFLHNGALYTVPASQPELPEVPVGLAAEVFQSAALIRSDDVASDPRYGAPSGVRSCLAAPVVARSGEVLGGLFFGHPEAARFTETHEAIVTGIAAQAAIALDNARLFEQGQHVQEELKRSNDELRRVNRDLEMFAYSASHDLQEPLRTIGISAQFLERGLGKRLESQDAAFLSTIITAAQHMNALIEDLLTYTRATRYEGTPPVVDANAVLAHVLENMRGTIEQTKAIVIAAALPMVRMHEQRLALVLQNLISNAIKYRGSETPRVEIAVMEQDGWLVFSVKDNGIGIEPQYAELVFGLFKRLHARDQYPGSGLGLAVCQRVVEQYGGRIWLERSGLGEGSTFCFTVPSGQ
jgi:PAS domain S-box-containing protein